MRIPTSEIGLGIKTCIDNSKQILNAGKLLFDDGFWKYSVILYYYSLEEFGKALILKNRVMENSSQYEIEVSDFFYDHDKKIEEARKILGDKADIIQYKEFPSDGQFHTLEEDRAVVDDFKSRSSLWLIDYDSATHSWGKIYNYQYMKKLIMHTKI